MNNLLRLLLVYLLRLLYLRYLLHIWFPFIIIITLFLIMLLLFMVKWYSLINFAMGFGTVSPELGTDAMFIQSLVTTFSFEY